MKVLPHKGPGWRKVAIRSTRRSPEDPKTRRVEPPKIFVEVQTYKGWRVRHVSAKIRVRRGCYRYLVWRDGLEKREFYLGKVKILAPRGHRAAAPDQAAAASAGDRLAGVRK